MVGWSICQKMAYWKWTGDILWLRASEWILRLCEIAMLDWVHHVKPNPNYGKAYETQNSERGTSIFKDFALILFHVLNFMVESTSPHLGELIVMDLIKPWSSRGQVETLSLQSNVTRVIGMRSIDKEISLMVWPIMGTASKVIFVVSWLVWTFDTS